MTWTIRGARESDAAGVAAVYAPYVLETAITFENVVPDEGEIGRRMAAAGSEYPWLVAEEGGRILGYAYAGRHHERAAYAWAVNVSIYLAKPAQRRGLGRLLYTTLFEILGGQGFVRAYAGIALPNPASVGLHEALGFRLVGVYHDAGFKLGRWYDVGWWERALAPRPEAPPPPRPVPPSWRA